MFRAITAICHPQGLGSPNLAPLVIQHVGIEITPADVPRAVEFFGLLGFERVEPPPSLAEGFTWVEREGAQVHLMHEQDPIVPERAHLAVVARDFDAAVERLRAHDFEVERRREHWGVPRALALAPGGHRVELMAAAPGGAAAP
jgi:catechol 2,3-dioxygenase-like lactoylglutathione lyase family enzyme